jgi:hypothetical protein
MSLTIACLTCAAVFAMLKFAVLPLAKSAWSRAKIPAKIPRLMLLAVLEKLTQLSLFASLTFAVLAMFVLIASAGSASTSEAALHLLRRIQSLERPTKELEEWYKGWVLLISLLAFSILWYRITRNFARKKLDEIRIREYRRLAELRDSSSEEWKDLAPTTDMVTVESEITSLLETAQRATIQGAQNERIAALIQQAEYLSRVRMILDFDRRLEIPWDLPNVDGSEPKNSVIRFLTSRGFLSDVTWPGKALSSACTVLVLIAAVGGSFPSIDHAFQERLAHLRDIEIQLDGKESTHKLAEIEAALPPIPDVQPQQSPNSSAVRTVSSRISRSLSSHYEYPHLTNELRFETARTEILQKTGLISSDSIHAGHSAGENVLHGVLQPHDNDGAMTQFIAAEISREEKENPRVGPKVVSWADRYTQTTDAAKLTDYLTEQFGDVLFSAVPTPENPLTEEVADKITDPLKEQAGEAIKNALNHLYATLLSGQDPDTTLAQIRDKHVLDLLLTGHDRERFRLAMENPQVQQQWATEISNLRMAASSAEAVQDTAGIRAVLADLPREVIAGRERNLSYLSSTYPSEFPLTQESFARDEVLASLSPGAPTSASGDDLGSRVSRATSFDDLRNYSRVGGILIGRSPKGTPKLCFSRLQWSRTGDRIRIALLSCDGKQNPLGEYPAFLVNRALAYAADSRPTAVTMLSGDMTERMQVMIHPALVDTAVGNDFLRADEWIFDALTPDPPAPESHLGLEMKAMRAEREAYAKTLRVLDPKRENTEPAWDLATIKSDLHGTTNNLLTELKAFDNDLMNTGLSCASAATTDDDFDSCVKGKEGSASSEKLGHLSAPTVEFVSQVYEDEFRIDGQEKFLRSLAKAQEISPLRFTVQMTIDNNQRLALPEFTAENESASTHTVVSFIASKNEQGLLNELRDFTILQRVFRAGLSGEFGSDFDVESMVSLADSSTGGFVRCATPRWKDDGLPEDKRIEAVVAKEILELSRKHYAEWAQDDGVGPEQDALRQCSLMLSNSYSFREPASSIKLECKSPRGFDYWLGACRRGIGIGYKPEDLQACGFVDGVYLMDLVYSAHRLREALGAVDAPKRGWQATCPHIN